MVAHAHQLVGHKNMHSTQLQLQYSNY